MLRKNSVSWGNVLSTGCLSVHPTQALSSEILSLAEAQKALRLWKKLIIVGI